MVIIIFVWPDFQRQQYKGRARVLNKPHSRRRRRRVYYYFPDARITFNPLPKIGIASITLMIGGGKKIIIYTSWRAINTRCCGLPPQ